MKVDVNTKARLAFAAFLLVSTAAGAGWYFFSISQYATYQIYTQESVSGLIADAPVEFHGVEVGKVKSVRLVNPHSVAIVLSIDKTAPVTSASVATITSRGLATRGFTGYVYISLEDVGVDSRPLTTRPGEPYPIISTAPSKAMTLDTAMNQVNENVQVVTSLLESVLDKTTVASLKQSVDNLQRVTTALAENTGKLNSIVANTERASNRLAPLIESSHDTVTALQMQVLPEAHKALSNLDHLSTSVTDVATRINRDPSIVIRGAAPPPPGPGERK
ncbi:MCE family protein [Paraburkholderia sp. NMBU_R16]|uniref:MlaD family protein n=1 Tax=Paraburkholderia sp. NMBU_R16 TaxID=2698676 RepID=UPI0015679B81|nr:MlaD family protein [Paraburkholderia sp. NMBU_R16]NRO99435.1 MCE family protein [Paraburkholderia sp. NMBU_R16]